ncbi:Fc receptor-like protein 4 isoform X7 [Corvus kubaryi]|uniref:Fc receptor-like protein 4 isoform X7 n=1 Tax=Corvus kubaryi TaxID=68294 RepID=UPI001C053621|nr:Fc receptor-like protein 4 isoform X7 [Corvus kubaryi]
MCGCCCHGNRGCSFPGNRKGALSAAVLCGDVTGVTSRRLARQQSHHPGDKWPRQCVTASPGGGGQRHGREGDTAAVGPGWPRCPRPRGVRATWMWRVGGCDAALSPGSLSRPAGDCPRALSHKHRCPHGDSSGTAPHPAPGCRCPRGATPTQPCPFSLPAQTLGLAGAQTTQLLVQPPWTPPVLWDRVTLTCQGSATAAATTWYKDGQRWWQLQGPDRFRVTESGTYQCHRPGTGRSPTVSVSDDWLVLQAPAWALLEGDTVTLRCRSWKDKPVTEVQFYRDGNDLGRSPWGTELFLSPLQLNNTGRYRCRGRVKDWMIQTLTVSEPVTVTVHGVPLSGVSVSAQPPGAQVALGDRLVLSCAVAAGTGPLSFSWHRGDSWAPLGTGPRLELSHVGDNDSGHYQCRASDGDSVAESVPLNVTVLVPVANATISPGALAQPVSAGDPVSLRCSVQVGSAPVTFTWLRNGHEVARGPLLELGDVHVGHSGTYQCVATNQLGQDGHRVFRALSPELALAVTPRGRGDTALSPAVAAGVGGSLLSLVLLVGAAVGWHRWHRRAPGMPKDRTSPVPPEEGEVFYTYVVPTKRPGGSPSATPEAPQVTYAELPGPRWHPGDGGDIYENVL